MKILFNILVLAITSYAFAQNTSNSTSMDLSNTSVAINTTSNNILTFDGLNDYVDLGDSVGNGVRTIELWFKPTEQIDSTLSTFRGLVVRETSGSNIDEFGLKFQPSFQPNPGCLRWAITEIVGSEHIVESDIQVWEADTWYHVAAVVDPTLGMKLFINGILQSDTNSYTSAPNSNTSHTTVGSWGISTMNRFFKGSVDDVRLSSTALYSANFSPPCPDQIALSTTVGIWNFNEDTGNVVIDSSLNAFNGSIVGATRAFDEICPETEEAEEYNVLSFDGIDDYLDLGDSVGNGVRTIELWFKPTEQIDSSLNDFIGLLVRETSGNNIDEFGLEFQPSFQPNPGHLRWNITEIIGSEHIVESDIQVWEADTWYHVAAVVDPTLGMKLFINGILQSDTNSYTSAPGNNSSHTTVGSWGLSTLNLNRYFEGRVDDVRLSTTALYTTDFTPPCPDQVAINTTVAVWNFNENDSTIAIDSSQNIHHATLVGATRAYDEFCEDELVTNALFFDGQNDKVSLGTIAGNSLRTIEMWFKPEEEINSTGTNFQTLTSRGNTRSRTGGFSLAFLPSTDENAGSLRFNIKQTGSISESIYSNSTTWNADQWYHVAGVVDSALGMMLFIDGIQQLSTSANNYHTSSSSDTTFLGTWGTSTIDRYFHGEMDDVRFSIDALYTSNFTPYCPDQSPLTSTTGLWNFNGSGLIVTDSTANANNGQLIGAQRVYTYICENTGIGLEEIISKEGINLIIYPNPSRGLFNFELKNDDKEELQLTIFSPLGQKLLGLKLNEFNQNFQVNLSEQSNGMYYYQLSKSRVILDSGILIKK